MGTVNQEEQLARLVDALESISISPSEIAVSLDSLDKNIDGCISAYGNNHFLCITGNVSTN